ncbi:hypothetical protein COY93_04540 [Candidatus Uhrbacteria bacterium CG_4_10_14_0_8_um_filter_58_22]|uniref:Uncharacterized protein n=1 Tax=Candidatus Uhrbacteria bacterium CG_4_10_14_0_8_um_filter_58_22 TaxID=1975029 RepID=A0A2M7Q9L1_9BACT|nr:MAG: hypothetical protein AUJ19_01915 [Parcubacteria group bacterium CG1_02_58_44]PIY61903.1 MAG: hypothetical protein COY93_04540 [Candidatus Uhrbacteria bacterium CG_4_10_14_0_8_um_filter_58_22]
MDFVNGSSQMPIGFSESAGGKKIEQLMELLQELILGGSWLNRLGIIERTRAARLLSNCLQHFQPGQSHGDCFYCLVDGGDCDSVIFTVTEPHQTVLDGEDAGEPIAVLLVHLRSSSRCVGYRTIRVHADGRVLEVHYDPTNAPFPKGSI